MALIVNEEESGETGDAVVLIETGLAVRRALNTFVVLEEVALLTSIASDVARAYLAVLIADTAYPVQFIRVRVFSSAQSALIVE